MISKFLNIVSFRAMAELRSEATRTYAGFLWWIFEPLLSLAVYYAAFKYIFHRETDNFAIFLFSGIIVYRFFSGTVIRSATSISGSQGLMQLVYIHKSIFPLSVLLVNLVKFLVTALLVIVVVWLSGIAPSWSYLALPVLVLVEMLVIAGISMICAAITPFFPDFELILDTLMNLLIFLSGVFYDTGTLSPRLQNIIRLNPVAVLVEQFRAILLNGKWPVPGPLIMALAESVIFIAIGWLLVNRFNRYFPKLS
jgi:lipopolysaccharide transport system permease protein